MNKHTPEPWRLYRNDQSVGDDVGHAVCDVWPRGDDQMASEEGKANARRIVACVNELAGLTTEQIEDGAFAKMRDDRDFLLKQRAELLSAMESLYAGYLRVMEAGRDRIRDLGGDCDGIDVMELNDPSLIEARKAIAKAKGGAA